MLEQCCNRSKQCRNTVATLSCGKNRRCESFSVTSPLLLAARDVPRRDEQGAMAGFTGSQNLTRDAVAIIGDKP